MKMKLTHYFIKCIKKEQIVKQNDNLTEMICPECLKNIFAFLLKYKDNKLIVFSLTTENIEKNEE